MTHAEARKARLPKVAPKLKIPKGAKYIPYGKAKQLVPVLNRCPQCYFDAPAMSESMRGSDRAVCRCGSTLIQLRMGGQLARPMTLTEYKRFERALSSIYVEG
jgi:hypothetical protein